MIKKNESDVMREEVNVEGAKNVTVQWLIDDKNGAPNFAMRRFAIGEDGHTPLHEHEWEHEIFVLGGEGALVDEHGEEISLKKNDFALVPQKEIHQFKNIGNDDFIFLCLIPLK
jgi:quercetin dioxygenase-like cupin family protein